MLFRSWFTQGDYPIEMAADGPEAMQKLQESSWDILLTDVKMPGMDGLELQQKAKDVDPDLTVIVMTAYASVDSAMKAIKEGAYDYVTKPLDPEDLEQIVNRAAERRQLLRENLELKQRIAAGHGETEGKPRPGELSLAEVEKRHIQDVLAQVSGDVSKAANALQIDEATLDGMLRKHGLAGSQE